MAHLCLLDENGAVAQRWEIGDQPMAIGRGETADVTVHDDTLSRRHFTIRREGEAFLIEDLNSQNGTWVDGKRVRGTRLSQNVCIAAGRTLFMFSEGSRPAGPERKSLSAPRDTTTILPASRVRPPTAGSARPATGPATPTA